MLKADQDRLDRERSIYEATRGPDYSRVEREIGKRKAEVKHRYEIAMETYTRERAGHMLHVLLGELPDQEAGFRDPPGLIL